MSVLWWMLACGGADAPVVDGARSPHVVLVTLDTTRADALSCYGASPGTTPVADGLAEQGVRFSWALSHVPSTLSAHASMLTGLDPHGHGIPRNGVALEGNPPTLAVRLASLGYDTLAVVAASVLDSSMGLDRGFRVYDDDVHIDQRVRYEDRADSVTRRALEAVDRRREGAPLLLWVHYFDAHHPYEAPAAFSSRYVDPTHEPPWGEDPDRPIGHYFRTGQADTADMAWLRTRYQGEIAWQDDQVGVLLEGLRSRGLLDEAIVVLAGDHGEMFGEEPDRPIGHSFDVDLAITHVPLIVWAAGTARLAPRVVDAPVRLSDLGPTRWAAAGGAGPLGTGRDLGPLMRGQPREAVPVFLEATRGYGRPIPEGGWNNATNERGVVLGQDLLIDSPFEPGKARTYRLAPGQPRVDLPTTRRTHLERLLQAWEAKAPPYRPPPRHSLLQPALEALGYLDPEDGPP